MGRIGDDLPADRDSSRVVDRDRQRDTGDGQRWETEERVGALGERAGDLVKRAWSELVFEGSL